MDEDISRLETMFPSFEADNAIAGVTMVSLTADDSAISCESPSLGREKENTVSDNVFEGATQFNTVKQTTTSILTASIDIHQGVSDSFNWFNRAGHGRMSSINVHERKNVGFDFLARLWVG